MHRNLNIGQAGELRVASELLLRGHEVFLTFAGSGADLVLGTGKKIQVKTASRIPKGKFGRSEYMFTFMHWSKKKFNILDDIDYVILWCLGTDLFYIIPSEKVKGKWNIRINPVTNATEWKSRTNNRFKNGYKLFNYREYENKWDILSRIGGDSMA